MPPALNEEELRQSLERAVGQSPLWTRDPNGNLYAWLALPGPALLPRLAEALSGKVRLCTITPYAESREDGDGRRAVAYHFIAGRILLTVTVPIYDPVSLARLPVPSITPWFRNADWNEREFHEMYDIEIQGHPDLRRLFLDERLDAGIMNELVPFSVLANSAGTKVLWELVMAEKTGGAIPEDPVADSLDLEPEQTVEDVVSAIHPDAQPSGLDPENKEARPEQPEQAAQMPEEHPLSGPDLPLKTTPEDLDALRVEEPSPALDPDEIAQDAASHGGASPLPDGPQTPGGPHPLKEQP